MHQETFFPHFGVQNKDETTVTAQKIGEVIPVTPQWYTVERGMQEGAKVLEILPLKKKRLKRNP